MSYQPRRVQIVCKGWSWNKSRYCPIVYDMAERAIQEVALHRTFGGERIEWSVQGSLPANEYWWGDRRKASRVAREKAAELGLEFSLDSDLVSYDKFIVPTKACLLCGKVEKQTPDDFVCNECRALWLAGKATAPSHSHIFVDKPSVLCIPQTALNHERAGALMQHLTGRVQVEMTLADPLVLLFSIQGAL